MQALISMTTPQNELTPSPLPQSYAYGKAGSLSMANCPLIRNNLFVCILFYMMNVLSSSLHSQGFSEPSVVFYGKVVDAGGGQPLQLFDGHLEITFVNESNAQNSVTLHTPLEVTGSDGAFSYSLDAPQKFLPRPSEWDEVLSTGGTSVMYRIKSIRVNGQPADPLLGSSDYFENSSAMRGAQVRLDLIVALDLLDTDGDGIPDAWEIRHGLNPNFSGDAVEDRDNDGLNTLEEYLQGTDPDVSNKTLRVLTQNLLVPKGGNAGFSFLLADSDTVHSNINLTITSTVSGLDFFKGTNTLSTNSQFTYKDVLSGDISIRIHSSFSEGTLPMTYEDTVVETGKSSVKIPFNLKITAFSPATQIGPRPALWLSGDTLGTNIFISEWNDGTPHNRDGFQSGTSLQPSNSVARVHFDGGDYLYLDDKGLDLSQYTAFVAFDVISFGNEDISLLSTRDLEIRLGGNNNALHNNSLQIFEKTRQIDGPVVSTNITIQLTLLGGRNASLMSIAGEHFFPSHSASVGETPVYSLLGARRLLGETVASQFLTGSVRELLIYDETLDPHYRTRNEDYQLSRWNGLRVWDYRDETAPVTLTGTDGIRNSLNGGWGNDVLNGGDENDILRGGPGEDSLTGNAGSDRFQILDPSATDTLIDFNETESDILDLTALFADRRGSPFNFLNLRTEVIRNDSNEAVVQTIVELNLDGDGSGVDKQIILNGTIYTNADLPRLVGEGIFQLCGPRFETAVEITTSEVEMIETEIPRLLTIHRTGNLDAALDINLSFTGTADVDSDYSLSLAANYSNPKIRSITLAKGQTSTTLNLKPIQDTFKESERIIISVLPRPQITQGPEAPLKLELNDAPMLFIHSLNPYGERLGSVPGVVEVTRSGPLVNPLQVDLQFSGTGINGQHFEFLTPSVIFPAETDTVTLHVVPKGDSPNEDQPKLVHISLLPDLTRYTLPTPWTAAIMLIDSKSEGLRTFSQWVDANPNLMTTNDYDVIAGMDQDKDLLNNFQEYVYGTDPFLTNPGNETKLGVFKSNGFLEIYATTLSGLTDASLQLVTTDSITVPNWQPVGDHYSLDLHRLADGRTRRIYRSRLSANNLDQAAFFGLQIHRTPELDVESSFVKSLESSGYAILPGQGPVWVPSLEGEAFETLPLKNMESSTFVTYVSEPSSFQFDWKSQLNDHDFLELMVNGVLQVSQQASNTWSSVNFTNTSPGVHRIQWEFRRESSSTNLFNSGILRNLSIIPLP